MEHVDWQKELALMTTLMHCATYVFSGVSFCCKYFLLKKLSNFFFFNVFKLYRYLPIIITSHRWNHSAMCSWIFTYRPTKWHSNVFSISDDMSSLVTQILNVCNVFPIKMEKFFRRLIAVTSSILLNMVIWNISAIFFISTIKNEFAVCSEVWLQLGNLVTPSIAREAGLLLRSLDWVATPFIARSKLKQDILKCIIVEIVVIVQEVALHRCSKKVFWKYAVNLQGNTNAEVWFQKSYFATLLKSYLYVGVLVRICCILAKHFFIKTTVDNCLCRSYVKRELSWIL